jgi:hypothetical protein
VFGVFLKVLLSPLTLQRQKLVYLSCVLVIFVAGHCSVAVVEKSSVLAAEAVAAGGAGENAARVGAARARPWPNRGHAQAVVRRGQRPISGKILDCLLLRLRSTLHAVWRMRRLGIYGILGCAQ